MSAAGSPMDEAAAAPLISVIIPAYNQAAHIDDALDSVIGQTYTNWECVVVDDGSRDDTPAIVNDRCRVDARIRYARQANAGPSAARNTGVRLTTGPLVQLLDGDDLLGPCKLERHARILGENPAADLVYGRSRYFRGPVESHLPAMDGWLPDTGRPSPSGSRATMLAALVDNNIMVVEAPLFRRNLVDRIGTFDPRLRTMEDWELWLRYALGDATFLFDRSDAPDAWAYVRVHGTNSSRDLRAMVRSELAVRRQVAGALPDESLRKLNRRRFNEGLARLGFHEGAEGDLVAGIRYLVRAGRAERRITWLAMAAALPTLRLPFIKGTARAIQSGRRQSMRRGARKTGIHETR